MQLSEDLQLRGLGEGGVGGREVPKTRGTPFGFFQSYIKGPPPPPLFW